MSEEQFKQCDELHRSGKYQENIDQLEELYKADQKNFEVLWRLSRSMFDKADIKPDDKEWRKAAITRGKDLAEQALAIDDKRMEGHKWYAIHLSVLGDYVSTKEKIGNAFKVREHADKAHAINPKDHNVVHLIGRWCFGVASIGWMERGIASTLFATPPTSSYDEALQYYMKVEELLEGKGHIRNKICIGDTYVAMGKKPDAKPWFEKAIAEEAESPAEKQLQEEAKAKMKKC